MSATDNVRLLDELQRADQIIKTMLNTMTPQQKARVHEQLDGAGVSGEGMTRANERRAAIEAAAAPMPGVKEEGGQIARDGILCHIRDIGAQAHLSKILIGEIFDKLEDTHTRDEGMRAALDKIECFAICASRNIELIAQATDRIEKLSYTIGGAA